MSFTLRQYQTEAVDATVRFFESQDRYNGLLVLPTGSGKSLVIANIAQRLGEPVIVFQPSREILEQNLEKFRAYGFRPSIYSASMGRKSVGDLVTLATIGSVAERKGSSSKAHLFDHVRYVIVDEADLANPKAGMYKGFFEALGDVRIIGLTATPYRMQRNSYGVMMRFLTRSRPKIFHKLIYYIQTKDLFDEGYLCKLDYKVVKGFDRHAVALNTAGTDYDERALQGHLFASGSHDRTVKVVNRLIEVERQRILIFCRFVRHANYVAERTGASVVTDKTGKDERRAIVDGFRKGSIKALVNVKVFTAGADFPELDTVVLDYPTRSLRLAYQMMGRGVRVHPGKESCWMVDMCGITHDFGHIEDLELVDGGNGKWFVRSGHQPLTDVYLNETGGTRCSRCGAVIPFWLKHVETGNAAPMAYPRDGIKPNIAKVQVDGKMYYSVVEPGAGTLLSHYAVCQKG